MSSKERQAKTQHPKLYALGQHPVTKVLGFLSWTRKAQKVAKKHSPRREYSTRRHSSKTTVVYVYGGTVNL